MQRRAPRAPVDHGDRHAQRERGARAEQGRSRERTDGQGRDDDAGKAKAVTARRACDEARPRRLHVGGVGLAGGRRPQQPSDAQEEVVVRPRAAGDARPGGTRRWRRRAHELPVLAVIFGLLLVLLSLRSP